jgi:signal transduction histidine kinase
MSAIEPLEIARILRRREPDGARASAVRDPGRLDQSGRDGHADARTAGPDGRRGLRHGSSTFVGGRGVAASRSVEVMHLAGRASTFWRRISPRLHDSLFSAIALAVALVELAPSPEQPDRPVAVHFLVGLAAAATLWWRRRAPVAVTGAGIAQLVITQGVPVVMCVGLFTLAVRRRDRVLLAMTVAAAAAVTLVVRTRLSAGDDWLVAFTIGATLAAFCALAGSYVGARRDLIASLRDRAERAEQAQELRAEQARLAERAKITREMHDVLAHKVSLIALHAGALEVTAEAGGDRVGESAQLVRTTAHEAMEDLRHVLGVLGAGAGAEADDLTPQPTAADIERVVAASRAAGVQAELTMTVTDLPDSVTRDVYRVVCEGLTNVHKHARGAATTITVRGDAECGVTVEVVNRRPVSGAALLPGSGIGLLGLRERVALHDGMLEALPLEDGGWRLAAWLPWPRTTPSTVGRPG